MQRAVFEHIAVRGAPVSSPSIRQNGGFRRPVEAARLKGLGVRPGVPDVVAFHLGQVYAIELKCVRAAGQPTLSCRQSKTSARRAAMLRFAMASIARSPCSKAGACCAAVQHKVE